MRKKTISEGTALNEEALKGMADGEEAGEDHALTISPAASETDEKDLLGYKWSR